MDLLNSISARSWADQCGADDRPRRSLPVTGQALSRKRDWRLHERSFWAADLYSADERLVEPTLAQAVALTGAGSTSSALVGPPA